MSLIDDHVQPLDLGQKWSILDDVLVSRQENLEVPLSDLLLCRFTLSRSSFVRDDSDGRSPSFEFGNPVRHRRERDDDEVGTGLLLVFDEVRDERESLNRLPETLCIRTPSQ